MEREGTGHQSTWTLGAIDFRHVMASGSQIGDLRPCGADESVVEAGEVTDTEARPSAKSGDSVNRLHSPVAGIAEESQMQADDYVRDISTLRIANAEEAGGKGANLGELVAAELAGAAAASCCCGPPTRTRCERVE